MNWLTINRDFKKVIQIHVRGLFCLTLMPGHFWIRFYGMKMVYTGGCTYHYERMLGPGLSIKRKSELLFSERPETRPVFLPPVLKIGSLYLVPII